MWRLWLAEIRPTGVLGYSEAFVGEKIKKVGVTVLGLGLTSSASRGLVHKR